MMTFTPVSLPSSVAVNITSPLLFTDMIYGVDAYGFPGFDGVADTLIAGVTPFGNQFQVNTVTSTTAENCADPSIGMDTNGNFTIAWDEQGLDYSFFNLIYAQRFDYGDNPLGSNFEVNTTDNTTINFVPTVGVSGDGLIAIGWTNTNDPNYLQNNPYASTGMAKVYTAQGTVMVGEFGVNGVAHADSIAFDANDDFTVAGVSTADIDNIGGPASNGVFAVEYQAYSATGGASGTIIHPLFRVNSANNTVGTNNGLGGFNPATNNTFWPFDQESPQAAMDANGDLTVAYSGFGPDVSETEVDVGLEFWLIQTQNPDNKDLTPQQQADLRAGL